jgi:FkbH-like protein
MSSGQLRLRAVSADDLESLLRWRNQPGVRRWMIDETPITPEQHQRWWSAVAQNPDDHPLLLERVASREVVAFVRFYNLTINGEGEREGWWGFYLTDLERRAAGERLTLWLAVEEMVLDHGHRQLDLRRIWCETLADNRPVLELHRRSGFVEQWRREVERASGQATLVIMMHEREPPPLSSSAGERAVVIGSANWEPLVPLIGAGLVVATPPFGQWPIALADADPLLTEADWLFFCERFEDLFDDPTAIAAAGFDAELIAALDRYIEHLQLARRRCRGRMVVCDLAPVRPLVDQLEYRAALARLVERLNQRLAEAIEPLADCRLVALSTLIQLHGAVQAEPGSYWRLGRIPFHLRFLRRLGDWLSGVVLAWREETIRLVVVDLDQTLWGGVVGEDGIEGIRVGRDEPGSAHRTLQQWLLRLRERGVALAVASRNSEQVALEALASHPGMVLRPDHFAAFEIHWGVKSAGIRRLAEGMSLGFGSILFLDDSPHERAEVRSALPQVVVPDLPADVADWPRLLEALPQLALLESGESDRRRADRYRERQLRRRAEVESVSREHYLAGLAMQIRLREPTPVEWSRVVQLIQRTNQFNATTRRYSEQQLSELVAGGAELLALLLADRFSEEELVGVVILRYPGGQRAAIDTLLLSCRVLGRDVESATLALIADHLHHRGGVEWLLGEIRPTPRNAPIRPLYADHGFERVAGEGNAETEWWRLPLDSDQLQLPAWFRQGSVSD